MTLSLMLCIDGREVDSFDLVDGDDAFNSARERGVLDRMYELKESNPDSVVSVVYVVYEDPEEDEDRRYLTIRYDVSSFTDREIDALSGHAEAQGEAGDGYPDVPRIEVSLDPPTTEAVIADSDLIAAAHALSTLADLDEGEHVDSDELRRIAALFHRVADVTP